MKRLSILGVPLSAQRYNDAVDAMLSSAASGAKLRAHFCIVYTLVEASSNRELNAVFQSAGMVAMDGMPLVWLAQRRGAIEAQRVCGPDVMLSLCDRGRSVGLRHFFLGGRSGVPEQLAAQLTAKYPGLVVAGTESPPFRALSPEEDAALVERINAAGPQVVWIGLGSPRQEFWAAEHELRLNAPLLLPVGAAFDFHSGRIKRAPRWMQRIGLEWLYRLLMEPRRLWRRYLVSNARFLYMVAMDEVRRRRSGEG